MSPELPEHIRQILGEKIWRDTSGSPRYMKRLRDLYEEQKAVVEFNYGHLMTIEATCQNRGLNVANCNKPWTPLLWYTQFYPWDYRYSETNLKNTKGRLFVGEIFISGRAVEIWASVGSKLQFFTGPAPDSMPFILNKDSRFEIDWYWPLKELFGFRDKSPRDRTSAPGLLSAGHEIKLSPDSNWRWDRRQNNYIKALIFLLEAFPGLIMKKVATASGSPKILEYVQVYDQYPSFPFLGNQVDTTRPDLVAYLIMNKLMPEYDFMTVVISSARSTMAQSTAPTTSITSQQYENLDSADNEGRTPKKKTSQTMPLKRPAITNNNVSGSDRNAPATNNPRDHQKKRKSDHPLGSNIKKKHKTRVNPFLTPRKPLEPLVVPSGSSSTTSSSPSIPPDYDPLNPSRFIRYREFGKDGGSKVVFRQVWLYGRGSEL